jgi:putative FmdB family regulatory protein
MPIYEYRCKECKHDVEALQKLSDPPLVTCPACGKDALQKLVSAAGFQLKGSGWYVTDFRGGSSGGKKPKESDKPDTPATDGATTEAKPGAKTEAATATKSESTTKSDTAAPAASSTTSTSSSSSSEK